MKISDIVGKHRGKIKSKTDFLPTICNWDKDSSLSARDVIKLLDKEVSKLEKSGATNIRFVSSGSYNYTGLEIHFDRDETEEEIKQRKENKLKEKAKRELKSAKDKVKREIENKYGVKL